MHPLSPSYVLGLTFIVLVAILWSASSILTQYLYSDRYQFDSPFLLTYIGVSLFSLWLPTHQFIEWISNKQDTAIRIPESVPEPSSENAYDSSILNGGGSSDEWDHAATANNSLSQQMKPQSIHTADTAIILEHDLYQADPQSLSLQEQDSHNQHHWTHQDHFNAAAKIAPIWFLANWTYNTSLAYTTITSSTVLASTGSLFTFGFAVLVRDENFNYMKLSGVLLGVTGSVLTTFGDSSHVASNSVGYSEDINAVTNVTGFQPTPQHHAMTRYCLARLLGSLDDDTQSLNWNQSSLWGDALGLISAIGYGAYAVQTRILCPHDERLYSMQILLGYIGLICMIGLSPIALYQATSTSSQLTLVVLGFLCVKGLFDNVISDYLWLRSVILTNATVATVGLGLTIPLAFLSDIFVTDQSSSVMSGSSIMGALCVLSGFVLVNVGNNDEEQSSATYEVLHGSSQVERHDPEEVVSQGGEQELSNRHETIA
ncbi:hypothetical protein MPSEU_000707600 [Mayamaea pseudoterrestris]|nr:hypothetical protein MPSEU_000707600 [Mayamaea pseudoterrestris]